MGRRTGGDGALFGGAGGESANGVGKRCQAANGTQNGDTRAQTAIPFASRINGGMGAANLASLGPLSVVLTNALVEAWVARPRQKQRRPRPRLMLATLRAELGPGGHAGARRSDEAVSGHRMRRLKVCGERLSEASALKSAGALFPV